MTLSALALYAAVYFAAVATPGPGVAALVARVLGYGLRGVAPFILGFVVGDLVWLSIAATGLSIVARSFSTAFFVLTILDAIYLLYMSPGASPGRRARSTPLSHCASRRAAPALFLALCL